MTPFRVSFKVMKSDQKSILAENESWFNFQVNPALEAAIAVWMGSATQPLVSVNATLDVSGLSVNVSLGQTTKVEINLTLYLYLLNQDHIQNVVYYYKLQFVVIKAVLVSLLCIICLLNSLITLFFTKLMSLTKN